MTEAKTANAEQIEAWNGEDAQHWVAEQERFDAVARPFGERAIEALRLGSGERALDVGCGCGDTTLAVAKILGPEGSVLGVDISAPMLSRARERAAEAGFGNVRFEQADAQVYQFEAASFDAMLSRFGIMFFDDPQAAFANFARALRPGGRMAFVCWQELLANEWCTVMGAALMKHVPMPDLGPPGAPGMFAFADPDRVRGILEGAGLRDVRVDPLELPIVFAGSLEDVMDFASRSAAVRRTLGEAGPDVREAALGSLREAMAAHATPDGVRLNSAAWLVAATA